MVNNMTDQLERFRRRMPRSVREVEILRVAGTFPTSSPDETAKCARNEILQWVQKRAGANLPEEAWSHDSFDHLSGGRNSSGIRLQSSNSDIWAIRTDDPDKEVAERVWTTEVVIGQLENQAPRLSLRLLAATPEHELHIEPHTPGFLQQVTDVCPIVCGSISISATPLVFQTESEAEQLIEILVDPRRELPIILLTTERDGQIWHSTIDAEALSRATLGLAIIGIATPTATRNLTRQFGRFYSVFGGAARIYMPGFTNDSDPYQHRLILADQLRSSEAAERFGRWARQLFAQQSVLRPKLGRDVLSFADIKNASLELKQNNLRDGNASDTEQLSAAFERITALQQQIQEKQDENEYYLEEFERERQRAELAESIAQNSTFRIQQLTNLLESQGKDPDEGIVFPNNWSEFCDWCEKQFSGRLVLSPRARSGIRKPEYRDVGAAAQAIHWLATECRSRRISGGEGSLNNLPIQEGVMNASCGEDTYDFDHQGRSLSADWHIKSGGNTRDPSRCLRIYYCFDPQTQQIIVADMPAHKRTNAT